MRCFWIILTTIAIHNVQSGASTNERPTTVCESGECQCDNVNVTCTKLLRDPPFVLPDRTTVVHFVDVVKIDVIDNSTFTNDKLQSITWVSSDIKIVKNIGFNDLRYLDLSRNRISQISDDAFYNCPRLEYVDLSENQLTILQDSLFSQMTVLETIKLENNIFHLIPEKLFQETVNLKNISIGNPNLSTIANNALSNLNKLECLKIENSGIKNLNKSSFGEHDYLKSLFLSNSTNLTSIDNEIFSSAPNIEIIKLNNCGTINFLPSTIVSLNSLKQLQMFETKIQPNCQNGWFGQWLNQTTVVMGYEGDIENNNLNCPAKIYHTSGSITLQLYKKGIIDCMAFGNPLPAITWLVPGGLTFHENKEADLNISQHPSTHNWEFNEIISQSVFTNKNGSLKIVRMLRTNVGNYTCYASNRYGNDSQIVEVHLDSGIFFNIKINALILGVTSALGFLMLTILCCALKLLLIRSV